MRHVAGVGLLGLAVALGACSGAQHPMDGARVSVVATSTIMGDLASRVVECAGGDVATLMPVGADPHEYAPSSADVRAMVEADLVVANGLGLEEGLESAMDSAEEDGARILEVAPLVDPIERAGDDHDTEEHDHGSLDPHAWMDPSRMAVAVVRIGEQLTTITGDDEYTSCGQRAADGLDEVDAQVRSILAAVPADRRTLITDHDAFAYFAAAYDFDVAGVVIPGGSTLSKPSSQHLADLVAIVREAGVSAIFGNVADNATLLDTLAEEVGRPITVVSLYVGSLGPKGSGAEDYASMMVENAHLIADALAM